MTSGHPPAPHTSAANVLSLVSAELALPSRLRYALLLVVATLAAMVLAILLFTEPNLPLRTQLAFAIGIGIGLSWSAFALWVLSRRRVLYARHHVMASRLAIGVSSIALVGALILARNTQDAQSVSPAKAMIASAAAMLLVALVAHHRARRRIAQLEARRAMLTRALNEPTTSQDPSAQDTSA